MKCGSPEGVCINRKGKEKRYWISKYNGQKSDYRSTTVEYQLLKGYNKAVKKGDLHALTGFDTYLRTQNEINNRLIGPKTSEGVVIESNTTHFIDRVIGQTAEAHGGMRESVRLESVIDALLNPLRPIKTIRMEDGDVRQTYTGSMCLVTISARDGRLIQTNPKRYG